MSNFRNEMLKTQDEAEDYLVRVTQNAAKHGLIITATVAELVYCSEMFASIDYTTCRNQRAEDTGACLIMLLKQILGWPKRTPQEKLEIIAAITSDLEADL